MELTNWSWKIDDTLEGGLSFHWKTASAAVSSSHPCAECMSSILLTFFLLPRLFFALRCLALILDRHNDGRSTNAYIRSHFNQNNAFPNTVGPGASHTATRLGMCYRCRWLVAVHFWRGCHVLRSKAFLSLWFSRQKQRDAVLVESS